MEFDFLVEKCLQFDEKGIAVYQATNRPRSKQDYELESNLRTLINMMGERSSKAQGLKQVITSYEKLQTDSTQKLYVITEGGNSCQGILKIGYKNLFYRDLYGAIKEIKPTCLLDFYVHESCQRKGYGKILFETMLQRENIIPEKLAYDRPSPKLIGFLKKHYNLAKFIAQNNNFVVFDAYFKVNNQTNINQRPQSSMSHSNRLALQNGNPTQILKKSENQTQGNEQMVAKVDSLLNLPPQSILKKPSPYPFTDSTKKNNVEFVNNEKTKPMQVQIRLGEDKPRGQEQFMQQTEMVRFGALDNIKKNVAARPSSVSSSNQTNRGTQPWANTGMNTSSSNYGGHYKGLSRK